MRREHSAHRKHRMRREHRAHRKRRVRRIHRTQTKPVTPEMLGISEIHKRPQIH